MSRSSRVRLVSTLSIVFVAVIAPWALAQPPSLNQAVERLDDAFAAGAAPGEIDEALTWLLAAAEGEPGKAPELVGRLAAQLRPLGSHAPASDAARRQELVRRAAATLDALSRKLAGPEWPPTLQAAPLVAPANDACADAIAVTDGFLDGSTSGATNDGSASCGASESAPDVWYSFTAAAAGVAVWDTVGSAMDTVLSLQSACPDAGGDHELACSDDEQGLASQVERQMTAGETVWVRVSGAAGASGSFRLTTDARPPGSLGGTVTKAGAGTPIAGAQVGLFDEDGFFFRSRSTAADGSYLFAGLSAGDWFLEASASSFLPELWNDRTCPDSFCFVDEVGDPVTVGTGLIDGIDFDLEPAGSLEGRVTDAESGEPLATSVNVFRNQGFFRGTSTGANGVYRVTDLPPGTYTVATLSSFFFSEYSDELYDDLPCESGCDAAAGTPVTVTAGSTTSGIDFALDRLGTIAGTLTSAAGGQPIFFENLLIHDQQGNLIEFVSTNASGVYRIALATGTYFVRTGTFGWIDELYDDLPCEPSCVVTAGTPVTVTTANETAGIDFVLESFGRVAGEVTAAESGAPVNALVELYQEGGSQVDSTFVSGSYEFGDLVSGLYFVRVEADVFGESREDQLFAGLGCDPSCDVTLGTPVPVANSTVTGGIDFVLTACPFESRLTLANLLLLGAQTREACRTIAVGANVTVAGSGELVLRAGRAVSFGDGFSVAAGGRLAVEIDPEVGLPE